MVDKNIKTFKERWDEVDERCPTCGNVTKEIRGLTKQNIKKLFTKPTIQDIVIFVMMILVMVAAFSYQSEIKQYQELIHNPQELCNMYYTNIMYGNFGEERIEELKNLTIIYPD